MLPLLTAVLVDVWMQRSQNLEFPTRPLPRIPALGGQNQEVGEIEASLGYTVRPRKRERGMEGEGRGGGRRKEAGGK